MLLALYAGMSAGVIMTSDDLSDLGTERLRLWKLFLNPDRRTCRFPLLGQTTNRYLTRMDAVTRQQELKPVPNDPVLVQVRDLHATLDPQTGPRPLQQCFSSTQECKPPKGRIPWRCLGWKGHCTSSTGQ